MAVIFRENTELSAVDPVTCNTAVIHANRCNLLLFIIQWHCTSRTCSL